MVVSDFLWQVRQLRTGRTVSSPQLRREKALHKLFGFHLPDPDHFLQFETSRRDRVGPTVA